MLVLGAGAWGTAMAIHLARRTQPGLIGLWARSTQQAEQLSKDRENKRYLPDHALPVGLSICPDLTIALQNWRQQVTEHGRGLLVLASPISGLAELCAAVYQALGPAQSGEGLVWLCKGLVLADHDKTLSWPSDLVSRECPGWPAGALSGPSFAQEVAKGLPVALTLASQDLTWAREAAQDLHGQGMRVYASDDLIGVQLGGAIKNVLAIAAGVADTMALGANARAALITRGLAEAARLGQAMGAHPETFLGLATLGDLVLTATGDLSRNRRVGMGLAAGKTLDQVLADLGHVAEGVTTAPAIAALGERLQVELPITQAVSRLLAGQTTARQAMEELLTRDPTDEVRL
jgi:glycerol-3-phosphate dehydrogenase (NAD(P)+)